MGLNLAVCSMYALCIKTLDLKMGISQQQTPTATSQIAQDVLEQAEMILHVRMNATQAYIMYKTCYEKKLTPQNWKDDTMGMSYTPKQVIRETNFF